MRPLGKQVAAAVLAALTLTALWGPALAPVSASTWTPHMVWPTTGVITQPFGCTGFHLEPRNGSCKHFHFGIDIADRRGTIIRAAADGVVTYIGLDPFLPSSYRRYRSWTIVLLHSNGTRTFYAHLKKTVIRGAAKGDHVVKGQKIGLMSDTGLATGVHLHFGVIVDHTWINPAKFIDSAEPRH